MEIYLPVEAEVLVYVAPALVVGRQPANWKGRSWLPHEFSPVRQCWEPPPLEGSACRGFFQLNADKPPSSLPQGQKHCSVEVHNIKFKGLVEKNKKFSLATPKQ